MHSVDTYFQARSLCHSGLSDYAVAARLGVPRGTIQRWRHRASPPRGLAASGGERPVAPGAYAYLLGIYLGDGTIWRTGKCSWRMAITLDRKYPGVIKEVCDAVGAVGRGVPVRVNPKPGAKVIQASSPIWPAAFPQHGPGRKHERVIRLEPWQAEITHRHPRALLRGLIHSDGSRTVNRFEMRLRDGRRKTYAYPRYFFTNASADIRAIFCEHCDLLGIRWSHSNPRNISVANRDGVATLDEFVGSKA